jgi:hypothetical protein
MDLTPAQRATLKTAIQAEPSLAAALTAGDDVTVAGWLNAPRSPSFTVWRTSATVQQVGEAMVSTAVAGLTTANTSRLQVMAAYSAGTFNPSRADTRAAFDDVFSGSAGASTRSNLAALWRRLATRAEALLATGTGSDASPATLTAEGSCSTSDVAQILRG